MGGLELDVQQEGALSSADKSAPYSPDGLVTFKEQSLVQKGTTSGHLNGAHEPDY